MYPCLLRFNDHKIVTLLITKSFEGGMDYNCKISYCLKRQSPNQFVSWYLVVHADDEALLKLIN